MAARLIKFGIDNYVDGLDDLDSFKLETGTTLFEQATGEILKSGEELKEFCNG